jgi:hypothetical protein
MRKTLLRVFAVSAVMVLVTAGVAGAIVLRVGNIIVTTDGGFSPTTLPKKKYAPITIHGHGRLSTADGSLPPILKELILLFDKHGSVVTKGLPVCTPGKLAATTTAQARALCPGAIVGKGTGKAVIQFEESPPIPATSPITIFNGPRRNGNPTVLAHAHLTVPAPSTYVVLIEIKKIHKGRFGYEVNAHIPPIAHGAGIPIYGSVTIGREWTYKGKRMSYINASCPDGHLVAEGKFNFSDGTHAQGILTKPCKSKG